MSVEDGTRNTDPPQIWAVGDGARTKNTYIFVFLVRASSLTDIPGPFFSITKFYSQRINVS